MQLNASRIKVLQAQDDIVNAMKDQAAKDLLNVSRDEYTYKQLLKDLIVQVGTQNITETSSYLIHYIVYPTAIFAASEYVIALLCLIAISFFLWSDVIFSFPNYLLVF